MSRACVRESRHRRERLDGLRSIPIARRKNLGPSLYFLRPDHSLNGVTQSPSEYCWARSRREKGGLPVKRGGIMRGSQAVGRAGVDAHADEDAGRLADTLYALTRAIAAASDDLRALKALGSTRTPGPVARDLPRQSQERESRS